MPRFTPRPCVLGMVAAMSLGVAAAQDAPHGKVDPKINSQFQKKGAAKGFIERFESGDREVSAHRDEIVAALDLKPGMSVADVGAGSGLFTRLFAEKVGAEGKVVAVDVSREFLEHIARDAEKRGLKQVTTVLGSQDGTNLPAASADLVFLSEVYHHLENHEAMLASMRNALKPGGSLIVIDFDRVEGKSSEFVLNHIRASQETFRKEIEAAGFEPVDGPKPALKENFFARFRKPAESTATP